MAKQKGNTYPYPCNLNAEAFKDYVLVTDENKKKALVIGRLYYIIERKDAKTLTIKSACDIRPRITKGHLLIENYPVVSTFDVWCFNEESVQDYRDGLLQVCGMLIKEKKIYIKLSEPLVKYSFI